MPFIRVSSLDADFWEENPALSLISEFKDFKASEGAKKSGSILKAIFYIWDPKSNLRDSGIPEYKLIDDITKNLIKDKKFNWINYEEIKQTYLKYNISKLESLLLSYENQLVELDGILHRWKATKEDAAEKGKLIKLNKDLWSDYIEIKQQVEEEHEKEEEFHSGYTKSKLEKYGSEGA